EVQGVGPWTAHYIAMRALGEPDAFPAGDLGVVRALANGDRRPAPRTIAARAERWRPWRAYAVMALWTPERPTLERKEDAVKLQTANVNTPLGEVMLVARAGRLCAL